MSSIPDTFDISNYLFSDTSHFILFYINYVKWSPSGTAYLPNEGCGELTYTIVNRSWGDLWGQGHNLLYQFPGDLAFTDDGVIFELETFGRYQLGDHSV